MEKTQPLPTNSVYKLQKRGWISHTLANEMEFKKREKNHSYSVLLLDIALLTN